MGAIIYKRNILYYLKGDIIYISTTAGNTGGETTYATPEPGSAQLTLGPIIWATNTGPMTDITIPQIEEPMNEFTLAAFYGSQQFRQAYSVGDIKYLYDPKMDLVSTSYFDGNQWLQVSN